MVVARFSVVPKDRRIAHPAKKMSSSSIVFCCRWKELRSEKMPMDIVEVYDRSTVRMHHVLFGGY